MIRNGPIAAANMRVLQIPIHVPFAIAKETLPHATIAVVSLEDENGNVGLGEASPFPSLTGDSIETAAPSVRQVADTLLGLRPLQALAKLRQIRSEIFPKTPTAYVAVETAILDLYARQLGVPMSRLFGFSDIATTYTDITMPLMKSDAVSAFWDIYKPYEFKQIKIKVSGNVDEDYDMILALTRLLPKSTEVTLDGNQGYTVPNTLKLISGLSRQNIYPLFFEQPLPEDDWQGHKELTTKSVIPICLDETVKTSQDALRVANEKTASMLNLKIMKSGIEEVLAIIAVARAAGLQLMIGGMLESEIAMGASLQILCGTGAVKHVDLDTPFFMKERITKQSPWHTNKAELRPSYQPGLGLDLHTSYSGFT